jgi:hypothetical protein
VLACAIGVGPEIVKVFGYDIIITKNSAFFSMEMCEPIHENSLNYEEMIK